MMVSVIVSVINPVDGCGSIQFLKKMENSRFRCVFLDNCYLLTNKKVHYLYKATSKEFECLHESAMATMTFQDGGYFGFKVI
jgi:hypothetical protein